MTSKFQFNVHAGPARDSAQFGNSARAPIRTVGAPDQDVARVEIGAQNMDSELRIDGNPRRAYRHHLAPGANAR
jgi:hypothetical protein